MQLKTKPIAEMATAPTETRQETSRDIPKTIMDCFWGLSEVDDEKRHGSSVKLINNLLLLLGEQKGEMITPASKVISRSNIKDWTRQSFGSAVYAKNVNMPLDKLWLVKLNMPLVSYDARYECSKDAPNNGMP